MKLTITFFFFLLFSISNAQPLKKHVMLNTSAGASQIRYIPDFIWGGYVKVGASYYLTNKLAIGVSFDYANSNSYPKGVSIIPNSSIASEDQFVQRFVGISRSDWFNGEASFQYNSSNTIALFAQYDVELGKAKRWALSPKFGLAFINNHFFQTYLGTAYFTSDLLTGGKINYRTEFNNFIGFQYGMQLTKKLKQKHRIFLEITGESDNGASQKSYSAFKVGVGYAVVL